MRLAIHSLRVSWACSAIRSICSHSTFASRSPFTELSFVGIVHPSIVCVHPVFVHVADGFSDFGVHVSILPLR